MQGVRSRGGLVFKAHRRVYHSTLGLRVVKKKREFRVGGLREDDSVGSQRQEVEGPCHTEEASRFRIQDSVFRVQSSGLKVQGSGFRVSG